MHSLKSAAVLLAASLAAAGCVHSDVRQRAAIDPDAKTISMPPLKRGLLKGIGDALRADGWKITIDQAAAAPKKAKPPPTAKTAAAGPPAAAAPPAKKRKAEEAPPPQAHTRYRLTASYRQIERCRSGGPLYIYEIALLDNRGGGAVMEQSGRDCEQAIIEKFAAALRAKAK